MNPLKWKRNLGMLLLGLWLVISGLSALLNLTIPASAIFMPLLALAAGILILAGR